MKWLIGLTIILAPLAQAQIVATVGNIKITTEEFKRRYQPTQQLMNAPTKEQFLEDLIRLKVGVQEAGRLKLENETAVKDRFDQVLYNSLLEQQVGPKVEQIKISEAELREHYKKNPEFRLAHILIDVKSGATAQEREVVKKRAMEILDDVKNSKRPFEELVKLFSDDLQTKEAGGDIGYQSRVTLVPVLYDTALKMKVGEVKGLIETPFGFHIVKLIDKRSFDMADKQQIRAALFDEKRAQIFNDYFAKAKKQYKIDVNKEVLKSL